MRWLKRKLRNWINDDRVYSDCQVSVSNTVSSRLDPHPDQEPMLTFRIYSATNGRILEFHRYDRKVDRSDNSVYIIDKDTDIGEYVNKCLTLELMKV